MPLYQGESVIQILVCSMETLHLDVLEIDKPHQIEVEELQELHLDIIAQYRSSRVIPIARNGVLLPIDQDGRTWVRDSLGD